MSLMKRIPTMKLSLLPIVLLSFCYELSAEEYTAVTGVVTEQLVRYLGKGGKELLESLDKVEKAEAWKASSFDFKNPEGFVGMRKVEGKAHTLNDDQLKRLLVLLKSPSSYMNGDSKGTKEGVAVRMTTKEGSRVEGSWCLEKGNINFLVFDASGKLIERVIKGGFRNDRNHPMRPFSREILGGEPAPPLKIKSLDQLAAEKAAAEAKLIANLPIAKGAKVEVLAEGFQFLEGPACAPNGDLYFVDKNANKILHWQVEKKEVREVTSDSKAANGMQFDAEGRLIACQGHTRSVVAFDPQTGQVTASLTSKYEGKVFNNPNDLWIDPKGGIYFTDPAYKNIGNNELDTRQAYYISPDGKSVTRVTEGFHTPNGIVGTPDGKTLFITDRRLGRVYKYDINSDGTLSNKTQHCKVGADGMTLDEKGNLYTTPQGKEIKVFDPEGKELGSIKLPGMPSNVCFAGKDRKTLFITTHNALCSIQMTVSGQ